MTTPVANNPREKTRQRNFRLGLLFAAVLTALLLRLLLLGSKSLWLDEALSLGIAQNGLKAISQGRSTFDHPPLYFLLLGYWINLGQSEFLVRLPSALLGGLNVFLAYLLTKELFSQKTAVIVAWLIALSPLLIWYAQEARSYTLLVSFGLLSSWSLVRLIKKPSVFWWLLFTVSFAAGLYTHYVALLLVIVQVFLVAYCVKKGGYDGHRALLWLFGLIVAGLIYWPWLRTPAFSRFLNLFSSDRLFIVAALERYSGLSFFSLMSYTLLPLIILIVAVSLVVRRLDVKLELIPERLSQQTWAQAILLSLFLVLIVAAVVPRGYSVKRQLVVLWPFALILGAWFWVRGSNSKIIIASVLLISLIASLINVIWIPKAQWREVAANVHENQGSEDLLLLVPKYMRVPFRYYDRDRIENTGVNREELDAQLTQLAAKHPRIWLVSHARDVSEEQAVVQQWLEDQGERIKTKSFYNLTVGLFDIDSDPS